MSSHRFAHLRSLTACVVLAVAAPALAQDNMSPAQPASDLPEGSTLVERAIELIASEESRAAVASLALTGEMKFEGEDMGGDPEVESFDAKLLSPDKYHLTAHFTGGETAIVAHDGEYGWETEPGDPTYNLMDDDESHMFALVVPHGWLLAINDRFPTATTREEVEIEGVKHYRVGLEPSAGEHGVDLFINAESGQIAAVEMTDPDGVPVRLAISGWTETDGITLPSEARLQFGTGDMGMAMNLTYSKFTFNTVDESVFAMPEEVKRQLPHEGDDIDDGGN